MMNRVMGENAHAFRKQQTCHVEVSMRIKDDDDDDKPYTELKKKTKCILQQLSEGNN